jgi:hypothetical protein
MHIRHRGNTVKLRLRYEGNQKNSSKIFLCIQRKAIKKNLLMVKKPTNKKDLFSSYQRSVK